MKRSTSARLLSRNSGRRSLPLYELLEERRALAVTAGFASGTLTVSLNAASDAAFLQVDDGGHIDVGTTSGASNVYNGTDVVTRIVVQDSGTNAGQAVTFGGSNPFNLSGGLTITGPTSTSSGIETTTFNQAINAGSFPGNLFVYGATNIAVNAPLTTNGAAIALDASSNITLYDRLSTAGGGVDLRADSDLNGSGDLVLAPAVVESWLERQTITASDGADEDFFGGEVSLSSDGNTLLVGAFADDISGNVDQGSAYVFVKTGTGWLQQAKLVASDGAAEDWFGADVALSRDGNTAIIGAPQDDGPATNQGAVYIYTRSGSTWTQQTKLAAAAGSESKFGWSVALNDDGSTAVIGAPWEQIGSNISQGATYVFTRTGAVWTQQAKLLASDGSSGDLFGTSVALSSNGNTALVASVYDDIAFVDNQGSAYAFTRSGTTWSQEAKLVASDGARLDGFGDSVALSSDGNTALIGAPSDDVGTREDQGSAYVFSRSGSAWSQTAKLTAADGDTGYSFGISVALSGDGNSALVGGNNLWSTARSGAYTFARSGTAWTQQSKMEIFTYVDSVALSSDAMSAVVGTPQDGTAGNITGTVRSFSRRGGAIVENDDVWVYAADADLRGEITATDSVVFRTWHADRPITLGTNTPGALGLDTAELSRICTPNLDIASNNRDVTVTADLLRSSMTNIRISSGNRLSVSGGSINTVGGWLQLSASNRIDVSRTISTSGGYVEFNTGGNLTLSSATLANWREQSKFAAADGAGNDQFGTSIDISSDGNFAIIGSARDDVGSNADQGSAYIFFRSGDVWTQLAKLIAPDGASNDRFGTSVALSADGSTAIVGAPFDDNGSANNQGSAYIFTAASGWAQQAKLLAADGAAADEFGVDVALSSNGNTALIGSYLDDVASNVDQGSVYAFTRSGSIWSQQAKIIASDGASSDYFGRSVALSSEGSTALVGAHLDDVGTNVDQGSAYAFIRTVSAWSQQGKLLATDGLGGDEFGYAVDLSGDGNTALIGAYADDVLTSVNQGSAYVFTRFLSAWSQQAQLIAGEGDASDLFGAAVALSGDGLVAMVGADADNVGANSDQGSATMFLRSGTAWTQQSRLTAADGAANDRLGNAVALSGNGSVGLAGARGDGIGSNLGQGSVSSFGRMPPTSGGVVLAGGGYVAIEALDVDLQGSVSSSNSVSLTVSQTNRPINLGSNTAGALGLTGAELNQVFTPNLTIGHYLSGNLTVSSSLTRPGPTNLSLVSASDIIVSGGNVNSAGGGLNLSAKGNITLNAALLSNGGAVSLKADSDANGTGTLIVSAGVLSGWNEQAKLTAGDGDANDQSGWSVALSSDGNTAIVGAHQDDIGSNPDQGAAYIFSRSGANWVQQAKLTAGDGAAFDYFGRVVALSGDGNTAVVGACGDDVGANANQGSAYVFVRSGAAWTQQARLLTADGAAGDQFGIDVELSSDGNTVIVGSELDDIGANRDQGSATIFVRTSATWNVQAKLVAADGAADDYFSWSLDLSGDGNTAVVGAYAADVSGSLSRGAAYLFVRSGTSWSQQAKLTAADGAAVDQFGTSVAINGDGTTVIVGAYLDDIGANIDQGSAYVFARAGGIWSQQAKLTAADGAASDYFGWSVALGTSGDAAVIGARGDDLDGGADQGSAYLFSRSGTTWNQQARIIAAGGETEDAFGSSVGLSGDGETIIAGALNDDIGANLNQGAASIFSRGGGSLNSGSGTLEVRAADVDLQGTLTSGGLTVVGVSQLNRPVDLGSNTAGALGLTNAELNRIAAPLLLVSTLTLGGASESGTLTVSSNLVRSGTGDLELYSGGDLLLSGGSVSMAGGVLKLSPGVNGALRPTNGGVDATASAIALANGGKLAIQINGTTPDTQHTQLRVAGPLNLSNNNLVLSGSYAFSSSDALTIVSGTSITGNFNGLGNGAILTFAGQQLQISYTATSVVLRLAPRISVSSPVGPLSENNSGTQTVTFTISLPAPAGVAVRVNYVTTVAGYSNPATAVNDFTPVSGTVEFAPGEVSKTIPVLVRGDRLVELDELFGLLLSDPVNGSLDDNLADLVISDDDSWSYPTQIDFGTELSPIQAAAAGVGDLPFTAGKSLGWTAGRENLRIVDRAIGVPALRDVALTPNSSFGFAVPNGQYFVRITFGDATTAHDSMRVRLEGSAKPVVNTAVNTFVTRAYVVDVSDGRLDLDFQDLGGSDPDVAVTGIGFSRR